MQPITISGRYSPERRAEIEACAREVSAAAATVYDLLPLYNEADDELVKAYRDHGVKQQRLAMVMSQAAMDLLIQSINEDVPEHMEPEHRSWWRRALPSFPRRSRRVDGSKLQDPAGAD